jgi:Mannosyl-glycoprotein endo-beta-N-acetylglucosaminidase
MRIIGPPSATVETVTAVIAARIGVAPRFITSIVPPLWAAALRYGIDPVGAVAQSAKETGWGNFGGNVKPEFYNTGGIKIRHTALFPGITDGDRPLAHQMFPNWEAGAEAHVQHLRAYTGWPVTDRLIVDPRYTYVSTTLRLENFENLGGKWAPSLSYGIELVTIASTLQGK